MYIGPFWCVDLNGWLRFEFVNEQLIPQLSSSDDQKICKPWENIKFEQDKKIFWHIYDANGGLHSYLCFTKNKLYKTSTRKIINQTLPLDTCKLDPTKDSEHQWVKDKKEDAQYKDYLFLNEEPNLPLPLTPEDQIQAIQDRERALIEEQVQRQREVEEQKARKWQEIQKQSNLFFDVAGNKDNAPLTEDQVTELVTAFSDVLLFAKIEPKHFANHDAYLQALKKIINQNDDPVYLSLVREASRTTYDSLNDHQKRYFPLKMTFFFNLLTATYNHIRNEFELEPEAFELPQNLRHPEPMPEVFENPPEMIDMSTQASIRLAQAIQLPNDLFSDNQRGNLCHALNHCLAQIHEQLRFTKETYINFLTTVANEIPNNEWVETIGAVALSEGLLVDIELAEGNVAEFEQQKRKFIFDILRQELVLLHPQAHPFVPPQAHEDVRHFDIPDRREDFLGEPNEHRQPEREGPDRGRPVNDEELWEEDFPYDDDHPPQPNENGFRPPHFEEGRREFEHPQPQRDEFFKRDEIRAPERVPQPPRIVPTLQKEQLDKITELQHKLRREYDSCWPYPNKSRKFLKIKALDYIKTEANKGTPLEDILDTLRTDDKYDYKEVMAGRRSQRTAELFDEIFTQERMNAFKA